MSIDGAAPALEVADLRKRYGSVVALYQAGLHALAADQSGFTGELLNLGPFGSSHAGGTGLDLFAAAYLAIVAALATFGFARRDL